MYYIFVYAEYIAATYSPVPLLFTLSTLVKFKQETAILLVLNWQLGFSHFFHFRSLFVFSVNTFG